MPAASRIGDRHITHCSPHKTDTGSNNVFINDLGAARRTDKTTEHLMPTPPICVPHIAEIIEGSSNVFVNDLNLARIGDASCTAVEQGSPNVFAGG